MNAKLLAGALLAIVVAAGACQPYVPWVPPTQSPESTVMLYDSITWQAAYPGLIQPSFDPSTDWYGYMGWTIDNVDEHLKDDVTAGNADNVVFLLGTNDASVACYVTCADGWTTTDESLWTAAIFTPPAATCEVIVLPWLLDTASAAHRAEIDQARAWMSNVPLVRPNTVVVDWRPYAERPGVIADDGIHLRASSGVAIDPDPVAVQARADVIADGLVACP